MIKTIKGQDYVMVLKSLKNMDTIKIPAGSRLDAITYWNPAGTTGTLRLGAFVSGAGTNEVQTLTVTGQPTADGDLTIVLDGATGVVISILDADLEADVAAKIGAGTYPGWAVEVSGADVIFTSITSGARVGAFTFGAAATGTTAGFTETVPGVTAVADTSSESLVADVVIDSITLADLTLVENCFATDTIVAVNCDTTVGGSLSFKVSPILGL